MCMYNGRNNCVSVLIIVRQISSKCIFFVILQAFLYCYIIDIYNINIYNIYVYDIYNHISTLLLQGKAKGNLYIDDGHSYKYKEGEYLVRQFSFSDNQLTGSSGDPSGSYSTKSWLERVLIVGVPRAPSSVSIQSGRRTFFLFLMDCIAFMTSSKIKCTH